MRHLKRIAWVLAGLYATYGLGTVTFLSTPLFEKFVYLAPFDGRITIDRGWSWIPGRIQLRGVHLEIEDQYMHLYIDLPVARANLNLFHLFKRHLSIDGLVVPDRGGGVTTKIVLRTDADHLRYLAGLEKHWAKHPEDRPENSDPFHIAIRHIVLKQVGRIQIGDGVFVGRTQIKGGFLLYPGRTAEVLPAEIKIFEGGIEGTATKLRGAVKVKFDEFSVPKTTGAAVFRYLHADLDLHAGLQNLRFLSQTLPATSVASLDRGEGEFSAKVGVKRGIIQAGSRVRVTSNGLSLSFGKLGQKFRFSGTGHLAWTVNREGVLDLDLKRVTFGREQGPPLAEGGRLQAWTRTRDLDLVDPFKNVRAAVSLSALKILHPERLNSLLPTGLVLTGGHGELNLKLQAIAGGGVSKSRERTAGPVPGSVLLKLENLTGRYFKDSFGGKNFLTLESGASQFDLDRGLVEFSDLRLILSGMDFTFPDSKLWKKTKDWWLHLEVPRIDAEISKDTEKSLSARGSIEVLMRDSKPVLEELLRAKVISPLIYRATLRAPVKLRADFAKGPQIFELRDGELRLGGGPTLEGDLVAADGRVDGAWLAKKGILSVGLRVEKSKTSLSLFSTDHWLEEQVKKVRRAHSNWTSESLVEPN